MRDVRYIHPRSYDIGDSGARLVEGADDVAQGWYSLGVGIALADDASVRVRRGGARNVHDTSNPDRPGVANNRLPWGAAGDVLPAPPAHRPSIGAAFHVTWEIVPLAFASATRSSVARMISSTPRGGLRKVTPPMLGVAGEPSVMRRSSRPARSFSRTMRAEAAVVSGSKAMNSSRPRRATTSVARSAARRAAAAARTGASPTRLPRSTTATLKGC